MATEMDRPRLKEVRLRDLRVDDEPVMVVARVVSAARREVTRRSDGGRRPLLSGVLSDGTASVRFTWWDPPNEPIERGAILRAGPVQVRDWQGRVEVTFGWKTHVTPADAVELPTVDPTELPLRPLSELKAPAEGFRLEARVVRVQEKTVSVGQERRLLFEGVLADPGATIAFTAWSDLGLKVGDALRISGAYVRAFRGRPQLILDDRAHVERFDGGGLPAAESIGSAPTVPISELEGRRGAELAGVAGRVVGLLPPSGLVYRCPSCRRNVAQGLCRVHGAVEGVADLRARVVLDDGSAAATVNAGRPEVERWLGRPLSACLEELRRSPDPSRLEEELFERLFGRRLEVRGRATVDEFGVTIVPESVVEPAASPPARLQELRHRLAGGPR